MEYIVQSYVVKDFIKLNRLIVLFIASGFIVLSIEVYLQHYQYLSLKSIMWLPIVFGVLGSLLTFLVAIIFNNFTYYLFLVLMLISVFVGSLGLYFHNKWRFPEIIGYLFYGKEFNFESLITFTPPLAPSAFIAMGGLGIMIAIFDSWKSVRSQKSSKKSED